MATAIERFCRMAVPVLALAGSSAQAAGLAIFQERVSSTDTAFPGCSTTVCAENTNTLAAGDIRFNQEWNTGNAVYFIDGEARTAGDARTGAPMAQAHMRTNIGGDALAQVYYSVDLRCASATVTSQCAVILGSGLGVPVNFTAFGTVQFVPDATSEDHSWLIGEALVDIQGAVTSGGQPLSFMVAPQCQYVSGQCSTGSQSMSFAVTGTGGITLGTPFTVSLYAQARVLPNPNVAGGRAAGEVTATADPVFTIDPGYMVNGMRAADFFRLEYSPNLPQVPLPPAGLLLATALAAGLGGKLTRFRASPPVRARPLILADTN